MVSSNSFMDIQKSPYFDGFLYLILFIKILFLISMILTVYASHFGSNDDVEKYTAYQDKFEHLFIILMGILMIVIFYPHGKGPTCVDGHTKIFLYVFGILSVLGIIKNFKNKEK